MFKKNNNILLILIFFAISLALILAFIIEYSFGHQPCKLCIYERIPYVVSILLIPIIIFYKKYKKIILLILALVFIASTILSFYHFGIEQGFFNELNICKSKDISETLTKEQLLNELEKTNISCKDVTYRIMGLSLAAINSIFSLVLSVIFIKLFVKNGKN